MPMLARYLSKTVLAAMLVVLGVISIIDLVFTLADEMASTNRFYSAMDAVVYVLRTLPTSVYELLPYVALGGALIGLGVLASSQELLVMQSSGIRTPVLVGWVMLPVLGVMLFSLILGEWIAPARRANLRDTALARLHAAPGYWQRYYHSSGDALTIDLQYSLSDRIRYYWPDPAIEQACTRLFANLRETPPPMPLVGQYLPQALRSLRADHASLDPVRSVEEALGEGPHPAISFDADALIAAFPFDLWQRQRSSARQSGADTP